MIYKALKLIRDELFNYMDPLKKGDELVLGNIAYLDATSNGSAVGGVNLQENIVLSLVRIEEEKLLKNVPHYKKINQKIVYKNPPVSLNLYLLFTAGTKQTGQYFMKTTLEYLSSIIKFFQGKSVFTNADTPTTILDEEGELERFELIMDLYSPSFEEANYMWSTLGGRQMPHVCYKMRLIQLERERKQEERGIITEIALTT